MRKGWVNVKEQTAKRIRRPLCFDCGWFTNTQQYPACLCRDGRIRCGSCAAKWELKQCSEIITS